MGARREITKKYARQYQRATKPEKSRLLDALVETTGWSRDHARRAIRTTSSRTGPAQPAARKPRPRKYSYDALKVLQHVWTVTGQPSGKYLAAVMDDTVDRLVRFREFGPVAGRATGPVLAELRSMSAATIDRYLKPHRAAAYPAHGLSGTKPSHILRSAIPVRTPMSEPATTPGFLELDTVAHCGHTLSGEFLWTLSATDPVTGYTLLRTVKNKAFKHISAGLDWILGNAVSPVTGMDFDNGSEFMNFGVIDWAGSHSIPLTRSRPYKHNDNAHIEQRNGDWVRRHAFRYRYETDAELRLLNQLWTLVMARKNHLLPCVKAIGWTQTSAGRKKRVYDAPATPYQRLTTSGTLDAKTLEKLRAEHERLNPAEITRQITRIQNHLIDLAAQRTRSTRPAA